jgi:hypothetical protein
MGSTVGTAWWVGNIAIICWVISVYYGFVGAGNVSNRGDVSISVSLDESAGWIRAMVLVCTIFMELDLSGKKG